MAMVEDFEDDDGREQGVSIATAEFLEYVTQSDNLVPEMSEGEAGEIAGRVIADYDADLESMSEWLDRMRKGLDLAKLAKEDKTYPWPNASNVKYPLITSAALQFNARAYPAIVPPQKQVKVAVHGNDPQGEKAARAERVSEFESWQVSTQIPEWEEVTDRLLVQLPIVGTVIRKLWYDPALGRPRSKMIEPGCFIVNDKAKSLDDAPRMTELLALHRFEIKERERSGSFIEADYPEKDNDEPTEFLEQHLRLDLDEDGYEEPYIATVCKETQKLVRLVADFEMDDVNLRGERVISIRQGTYYIPYHFLPSIDGGFWGTGLGLLLGDISEAINTTINMIFDAGHMQSLGGGFIGREFRTRGGAIYFKPGEWKTPNASGNDLRNAIVPLDMPGPSPVLFQMLGLLIEAGREIASIKDVMTGDGGQRQMTATTTMALIEQGQMVFTAAYKRVFRALRREFEQLTRINAQTVDAQTYAQFHDMGGQAPGQQGAQPPGEPMQGGMEQMQPGMMQGPQQIDPRREFDLSGMDIGPVADPRAVTKMQEMARAQLVMELAQAGLVDPREAGRRVLEAASIEEVDELAPPPSPEEMEMQRVQGQMQAQAEQIQLATARAELAIKQAEVEKVIAEIEETRAGAVSDLADAASKEAGMTLQAQIEKLRQLRDDIAGVGRGAGGMAGASRDAAPSGNGAARPQGEGRGISPEVLERMLTGAGGEPGAGQGGAGGGAGGAGGFL